MELRCPQKDNMLRFIDVIERNFAIFEPQNNFITILIEFNTSTSRLLSQRQSSYNIFFCKVF